MKNLFSERIKKLRLENNLSQEKLANILHLSRTAITCWETRGKEPNFDTILDLATYFKVSTDYLLGLVDEI